MIPRLPELRQVESSMIERELRLQSHRNSACHLIYAVWDFDDGGESVRLVHRLARENSASAVVLRVNDVSGSAPRAWLAADHDNIEFIVLEVNGGDPAQVASLLAQIPSSGQRVLIWDNSLSYAHPLLRDLGGNMDRVIVSVIPPCSEWIGLKSFFALSDALGPKPLLTDIFESLTAGWQASLRQLLDSDPHLKSNLQVIRLLGEDPHPSAELFYLAAWTSAVLKWKPARFAQSDDRVELRFEGGRRIILEPNTLRSNRIELVSGGQTLACEEPESEIRIAELLLMQLRIRERDPLREESLRRIRLWLT